MGALIQDSNIRWGRSTTGVHGREEVIMELPPCATRQGGSGGKRKRAEGISS